MKCIYCNKIIPKKRLKVLPETQTCVICSNVDVPKEIFVGSSPSLAEMKSYRDMGINLPPYINQMLDARKK